MCFSETWLHGLISDPQVALDGFHLVREDRTEVESGKRRGGGLVLFVNRRWCNQRHIAVKEKLCSKDTELLVVSLRPYYLPREFSHAIVIVVYIPPLLQWTYGSL